MPGLIGAVCLNGDALNLNLIRAMRDAIRHRSWYQGDDYVDNKKRVAISRVNLNIINRTQQPYVGPDDKVKVFLHGEIYNDEAASNPLEFIYYLYRKEGINFAATLNGSFTVVVVDEDAVYIASDRIASKPLFYFNNGQTFYFGPEMKSLFLAPSLTRKLNLVAVADFLANGHFIREHTLVEDIKTMDHACVIKITANSVVTHRYWDYNLEQGMPDRGEKYYQEILTGLLRQVISSRLRVDDTYGVLLSGGYDSRGILGGYLEAKKGQKVYTISWGRREDIPNSDCEIARRLAQQIDADHKFYELTAEEVIDNFRDFILLGEGLTRFPESYEVFQRIRDDRGIKILLRGDECFGWKAHLVHDEESMFRTLSLNTLRMIGRYQHVLKPTYFELFSELDRETRRSVSARCPAKNIHNRKDYFYLTVRLKNFINPLNYLKNFAVESFNPFLDYRLLDFVSTLPVKYRLDKDLYKKTIVQMFPDLFKEMAQSRNDIDWATSFKESPLLKQFIYQELFDQHSVLTEFINQESLKCQLDAFFAGPSSSAKVTGSGVKARMRTAAVNLQHQSPGTYNLLHSASYYYHKWRGTLRDVLPPEQLIIRLLILKVWTDTFLNYPVVKAAE
jgi:asparagine synthetase B (glutamine-hydrolysing)